MDDQDDGANDNISRFEHDPQDLIATPAQTECMRGAHTSEMARPHLGQSPHHHHRRCRRRQRKREMVVHGWRRPSSGRRRRGSANMWNRLSLHTIAYRCVYIWDSHIHERILYRRSVDIQHIRTAEAVEEGGLSRVSHVTLFGSAGQQPQQKRRRRAVLILLLLFSPFAKTLQIYICRYIVNVYSLRIDIVRNPFSSPCPSHI